MAAHAHERGAHPDVVGAHGDLVDRVRLYDFSIFRTVEHDDGRPTGRASKRAVDFRTRSYRKRPIALIIALWEYRWGIRYLWSDEYKPIAAVGDRWHTPIVAVCVVLILIGFSAFGAVFWRVH
jgi:hypothetical protein